MPFRVTLNYPDQLDEAGNPEVALHDFPDLPTADAFADALRRVEGFTASVLGPETIAA